jgi:hypothetical protein
MPNSAAPSGGSRRRRSWMHARREGIHKLLGRFRVVLNGENAAPPSCHYLASPTNV